MPPSAHDGVLIWLEAIAVEYRRSYELPIAGVRQVAECCEKPRTAAAAKWHHSRQ